MRYEIIHKTAYKYSTQVSLSLNDACLLVRHASGQTLLRHQWYTQPQPDFQRDRTDFFGNHWRLFSFEKPHSEFQLTSIHQLEVVPANEPANETSARLAPFLNPSPYVRISKTFADYGQPSFPAGRELQESLLDLNQRLYQDFLYDAKATTIDTPVEEFFLNRQGVCQDFAHLALSILRSLGIPARYISGYLNTLPPPGKEKILGADATHAWIAAYEPRLGWLAFDPTNGIPALDHHIIMAWGRDYGDVTPIRGVVLGGGNQELSVEVSVLPRNPIS
jgi:transglutaminase-like putative cysteine protease